MSAKTKGWSLLSMAAADVAFQRCVNEVSSAYLAAAGRAVSFRRWAAAQSNGITVSAVGTFRVVLPVDQIGSNEEPRRLVLGFTPVFNPFRDLQLAGYWSDDSGLRFGITEGRPLAHDLQSASELHVDAVSFAVTQYHINMTEKPNQEFAFRLIPSGRYQARDALWLTSAVFSSSCRPQLVTLAGPHDRLVRILYDDSVTVGPPLISAIDFQEILPLTGAPLFVSVRFGKATPNSPSASP